MSSASAPRLWPTISWNRSGPCVDWRVAKWIQDHPGEENPEVTREFRQWVTGFPLETVDWFELNLEMRGVIEGVIALVPPSRHHRAIRPLPAMDPNHYKMGWLMVAFDLPVKTKKNENGRPISGKFLLDDGFQMIQFSVYARPCVTFARQETHSGESDLRFPMRVPSVRSTSRSPMGKGIHHPRKTRRGGSAEEIPEQIQLW